MEHLKVFVKADCPKCPEAKEVAGRFKEVEIYDLDDPVGLAEAAYYGVLCTPSLVLVDDDGREIRAWRCTVPSPAEIAAHIHN